MLSGGLRRKRRYARRERPPRNAPEGKARTSGKNIGSLVRQEQVLYEPPVAGWNGTGPLNFLCSSSFYG
jgi:hypothetical protein